MEEANSKSRFNKIWTIWNLVEEVILLAAGVLAIVVGCIDGNDDVRNAIEGVITYAIAIFIILDGLLRLIMTLFKVKQSGDESIMLVSGFEITLGIVIIIVLKEILIKAMVYFIAVGTIVIGAMFLAFSVATLVRKAAEKYFMPVLEIIFGGILIGIGLYLIILYNVSKDGQNRICLILTGTVLSIVAIALAITTLLSGRKRKKMELVPVSGEASRKSGKKAKKAKKEEAKEEPKEEDGEPMIIEAETKEVEEKPVQQIEHKKDKE